MNIRDPYLFEKPVVIAAIREKYYRGYLFKIDDFTTIYMLAQSNTNKFVLVSTIDGNRFSNENRILGKIDGDQAYINYSDMLILTENIPFFCLGSFSDVFTKRK